jgi:hypothetical protein
MDESVFDVSVLSHAGADIPVTLGIIRRGLTLPSSRMGNFPTV